MKKKQVEAFVDAVKDSKNVKAIKHLENILKRKCTKKISQVLNS